MTLGSSSVVIKQITPHLPSHLAVLKKEASHANRNQGTSQSRCRTKKNIKLTKRRLTRQNGYQQQSTTERRSRNHFKVRSESLPWPSRWKEIIQSPGFNVHVSLVCCRLVGGSLSGEFGQFFSWDACHGDSWSCLEFITVAPGSESEGWDTNRTFLVCNIGRSGAFLMPN